MAKRLPEIIKVAGRGYTRQYKKGKATNEWTLFSTDPRVSWVNGNFVRNRHGLWNYDGSPLKHSWQDTAWYDSPEEAYRGFMAHQSMMLAKNYERDRELIMKEIEKA